MSEVWTAPVKSLMPQKPNRKGMTVKRRADLQHPENTSGKQSTGGVSLVHELQTATILRC